MLTIYEHSEAGQLRKIGRVAADKADRYCALLFHHLPTAAGFYALDDDGRVHVALERGCGDAL